MDKAKKILAKALLVFALISIGFAMGKHSVKPERDSEGLPQAAGHVVAVYYLHATFRCVTCNTIEKMTRQLLDSSYSQHLADGAILWLEEDFQENERLAKQFEVISSCVVVVEMKDGAVIDYKRLDDVWTLMSDAEAFNRYISAAIDGYLKKTGGPS